MTKWRCTLCGYVYDPEEGDPDNDVDPCTSFENLPLDCPYWPAMQEMGYVVSFRRIEMRLELA